MQSVTERDLAENTGRVLDSVHHGEPTLVERHGEAEAAIVDITDYRLLRAAARYQSNPPPIGDLDTGLTDERVATITDLQQRYDLVIGYFLAGELSLSRAAALLGTYYLDLRLRLTQLGLPTHQGPATIEEALEEIRTAEAWVAARQP